MSLLDEVYNLEEGKSSVVLYAVTAYIEASRQHDIKINADDLADFIKEQIKKVNK